MNKILILGGSGLLGGALVSYFLKNNFQVGVLSRTVAEYENPKVQSYQVDILDFNALEKVFKNYNFVVNCIGQVTKPINQCLQLNTEGIENIVKAAKQQQAYIVHISTVSVYGTNSIVNEESDLNPESVYGSMKCFAEFLIKENLENYSILRVSNLFGKNQNKGILAYILRTLQNKETDLYFNNDGSLKRYYLHVDDLSEIIGIVLKLRLNGVYNIVGDSFYDIKELIKTIEDHLDYSFNVNYENSLPIENIDLIECNKIKEALQDFKYKSVDTYLKEIEDVIS